MTQEAMYSLWTKSDDVAVDVMFTAPAARKPVTYTSPSGLVVVEALVGFKLVSAPWGTKMREEVVKVNGLGHEAGAV